MASFPLNSARGLPPDVSAGLDITEPLPSLPTHAVYIGETLCALEPEIIHPLGRHLYRREESLP
jgi:hypothetical protein